MKKLMLPALLLLCVCATAQPKFNATQFASTITPAGLKHDLYIIAGADMEGRGTGTPGQQKAAHYIEERFRALELHAHSGSEYQLNYPIARDSLVGAALEVNGRSFAQNKDFDVNMNSSNTMTLYAREVVFAGYGISDSTRDDYKDIDATGKVVLVIGSLSGSTNRAGLSLQAAAAKHGAAAILAVQRDFPRRAATIGYPYVNIFRRTNYPDLFYISDSVAMAIMGKAYDTARAQNVNPATFVAEVKLECSKVSLRSSSSNVLAYLEGTDKKDEYVFITAHYDHLGKQDSVIFYGADDDGSGTVAVMALAGAFKAAADAGFRPRRTVVFMTVSGEERGLWGSSYYVEHPVFPLEKTTVDLNIDMIGRIDPTRKQRDSVNYVYVVGDDKISSDLRPINEVANRKTVKLELDYKFNDPKDPARIYYRSDHYNFARMGVPVIFYFNGTHKDYHRPSDTPDKINYDVLAKRAQLVFYTAWEMANRDELLKRDRPLQLPAR